MSTPHDVALEFVNELYSRRLSVPALHEIIAKLKTQQQGIPAEDGYPADGLYATALLYDMYGEYDLALRALQSRDTYIGSLSYRKTQVDTQIKAASTKGEEPKTVDLQNQQDIEFALKGLVGEVDYLCLQSIVLCHSGKYDKACALTHKAIAKNYTSDRAHAAQGLALMHLGNIDQAIISFNEAIKFNNKSEYHANLAALYTQLGMQSDALREMGLCNAQDRSEVQEDMQCIGWCYG